jgi:hypothetical protein
MLAGIFVSLPAIADFSISMTPEMTLDAKGRRHLPLTVAVLPASDTAFGLDQLALAE